MLAITSGNYLEDKMGILDIFKSNEFKQRIESLELENTKLKQESTVKLMHLNIVNL